MVRLKTRYAIVEVVTTRKVALKKDDISTIIKESIARSYGDFGIGMLQYAFQVLYYNAATKLIVVRSAREQMKLVETSLVFVTECHGEEIRFRVVRVCGCSRTCRQHLLSYSEERTFITDIMRLEMDAIDPQ